MRIRFDLKSGERRLLQASTNQTQTEAKKVKIYLNKYISFLLKQIIKSVT